jgi:hypothetical protein
MLLSCASVTLAQAAADADYHPTDAQIKQLQQPCVTSDPGMVELEGNVTAAMADWRKGCQQAEADAVAKLRTHCGDRVFVETSNDCAQQTGRTVVRKVSSGARDCSPTSSDFHSSFRPANRLTISSPWRSLSSCWGWGLSGARGRSRTDTLLRAADFLATSAFAAANSYRSRS